MFPAVGSARADRRHDGARAATDATRRHVKHLRRSIDGETRNDVQSARVRDCARAAGEECRYSRFARRGRGWAYASLRELPIDELGADVAGDVRNSIHRLRFELPYYAQALSSAPLSAAGHFDTINQLPQLGHWPAGINTVRGPLV